MLSLICGSALPRYLLFISAVCMRLWILRPVFRSRKYISRNCTWKSWEPLNTFGLSRVCSFSFELQLIYTRVAWRDEHTPSSGGCCGGTRACDLTRSRCSFIRSADARKNAPGHFPNVYNEYALTVAWVMRLRPRKGVIFARRRFPPAPAVAVTAHYILTLVREKWNPWRWW